LATSGGGGMKNMVKSKKGQENVVIESENIKRRKPLLHFSATIEPDIGTADPLICMPAERASHVHFYTILNICPGDPVYNDSWIYVNTFC
jgi:hypothetical protein